MSVGKNFSCNNQGKRKESDFYETPYSMTRQLLEVEPLWNRLLEPAAGYGAIVRVLMEAPGRLSLQFSDLSGGNDFLLDDCYYRDTMIITNPPYSKAFEFIQKSKQVCDKFVFLLPLSYLHGKKRYDSIWMDKDYPLHRVHVFTRYPMLGDPLREDGKYRTGMMVYAWFVWEKKPCKAPTIHWIDNNQFVLGKNDA